MFRMTNLVFKMMVSAMICGTMMVSCGGGSGGGKNTPSGAFDDMYKAYLKRDWNTYASYFNVQSEEERAQWLAFAKGMTEADKNPAAKYEILSERLSDDGTKAEISVKIVHTDGKESTDKNCFVKTDSGWKSVMFSMGACF